MPTTAGVRPAARAGPVDYPDSLPTTLDIGRGSPTAVAFGYGSSFPRRYRDALFILDWAYGRIIAVDVIPRGASYHCQAQLFVRGRPLNVTDLTFGPDGAMYFITGGRGTQSGLFRIRYDKGPGSERILTKQEQARLSYSTSARERRRQLETFHGKVDPNAIDRLWPDLNSPDPWIRHAARVALEHQPLESWSERALQGGHLTALLALMRVDPADALRRSALSRVRAHEFAKLSRTDKLTVIRIHEIALQASDDPALISDTKSFLSPFFPDSDSSVNRPLSKLLIGLGDGSSVSKALALLAGAATQAERLHYLEILSHVENGWTIDERRAFFNALRHRDYFRGDSNMPGYLKRIHDRAVASLDTKEREALNEIIVANNNKEAAPLLEQRAIVQHWKTADFASPPGNDFEADPARGRNVFEEALCSRCHQVGGTGSAVGPNLTAIAQRFSRRDLVEAIVDPSRAVAEIFRTLVIEKKDGTTVAGRVVRDDIRKSTISLSPNPFAPDELTVVAKKDIKAHQVAPGSPMPPGLLDTFSRDDVLHLLAFLESGGR